MQEPIIIHCQYSKLVKINELKPHPDNPNQHSDAQVERLAAILKYQGWRYPIKVSNLSGFITSGHGRLLGAKKLGLKEVPVSYQDYESEEQEYADVVSDNAIASWAELNLANINSKVEMLGPDFDIDLLGIKDFTIDVAEKLPPGADEDEIPEKVEPKTKLGDLYVLGRHRLLCGDSTNIQHVEKLMDGKKADAVYTDPPYGMNLDTKRADMKGTWKRATRDYKPVIGDDVDFDPGVLFGFFEYCDEIFLWGADYYAERLLNKNKGSWIVWDKRLTDELDAMWGSQFELCWSKNKHKREIARITWAGVCGHNKKDDGETKVHPTLKPVKLHEWFFSKSWFDKKSIIVDLFGGSGSTLIACEKTKRQCFMMELDPHYCDVIVARWEKYTGKKAELVNAQSI